jgi:ABC-type branched-subunit amino acid transport system ATPase component/predicted MFS family arabinose efflux permease
VTDTIDEPTDAGGMRSLTSVIFEEETQRQQAQQEAEADVVLPDDLLPGVGGKAMSLQEGFRAGGFWFAFMLMLLTLVEEFDRVAIHVLGPDIQDSLGISDTLLLGLQSFGGVVLVLSTLPFAWLADRYSRTKVLAGATGMWVVFAALTGAVVNSFQMGVARAGTGFGSAARIPITPSLIADQYPIGVRARMFAFENLGRPLGQVIGPLLAGLIVLIAGEDGGDWRWAFWIFAIPGVLLVFATLALKEPTRGRNEQEAVFGEAREATVKEPPVRLSAAFQRLKKVRTFYYLVVGIGVLGFALIAVPSAFNLLLEDEYGYGAFTRGWMSSITWAGALIGIPLAGRYGDKLFRRNPPSALKLMGVFVILYGVSVTIGMRFHEPALLITFMTIGNAFQGAAFTQVGPTISAVIPYQMRAQAFALIGVYIFLMGGFFGGLLAGALSDAHGERTALTAVVPPAALLGGVLVMYGARFMKRDISLVVAELLEAQEEQTRMAADPENIPVLQVRNLDASYGNLQVLFDVSFEVRRGETLALLGTNGAGKSTVLRAVSGLLMPDRGVVRMNGRTITLVDPQYRVGMGMLQIPGGEALFTSLTVGENLEVWGWQIEDPGYRKERMEIVYDTFPLLRERLEDRAGSLSGGQQQMLALGKAVLLEPDLLMIDELSLGLAPVVVQELLEVVERMKGLGLTMVIVEQSVNVALSIADRAVFMERGRIRFEGPAQELLERGDLLRAVFLSGEGA